MKKLLLITSLLLIVNTSFAEVFLSNDRGSVELLLGPSFRIYRDNEKTFTKDNKPFHITYTPWNVVQTGVDVSAFVKGNLEDGVYGFFSIGGVFDGLNSPYFNVGLGYETSGDIVKFFLDVGVGMYFQLYDILDENNQMVGSATEGFLSVVPRIGLQFNITPNIALSIYTKYMWNPISYLKLGDYQDIPKDKTNPFMKSDIGTVGLSFLFRF